VTDRFAADHDREYRMRIGDAWVGSVGRATFTCVDPFDRSSWGTVPIASADDVDAAVGAARAALPSWAARPPAARAAHLRRFAALLEASVDELVALQVHENGKLKTEIGPGTHGFAAQAMHFAGLAPAVQGQTVTTSHPGMVTYTIREPLGVVAAITPWNSPLGLLGWKLFPALAAGNTIVIKPSEVTPASTVRVAELAVEAELPAGVVNVITGFGEVGAALVAHPGVDKVAFTGSTATGRAIARSVGERLGRVSLELGGKGPQIVFADANLDRAVEGVMTGLFAGGGQACNAGSRVLVERPVLDEVVTRVLDGIAQLRLGDPLDARSTLPPVACRAQWERVTSFLAVASREHVSVLAGGSTPSDPTLAAGYFVEPTLYTDVAPTSPLLRDEIFGPVGVVIPFDGDDEAVAIANDTDYGLVAGCWTESLRRAHSIIGRLDSGVVWVNTWRSFDPVMPFGGHKQSGLGHELGLDALDGYTQAKAVWIGV
jgi:acyl-CoA reductase-like NAD-dependent aldehyde dehydrogenase